MWISSKKYEKLWEKAYSLQTEKDSLIRVLSGVVLSQGGVITIPIPSTDSRTLSYENKSDGTLEIKSEIYNLTSNEFEYPKPKGDK